MQDEGFDMLMSASDYKALKKEIYSRDKMIGERDVQIEKLKLEVMRVMQEGEKKAKQCKEIQMQWAKEVLKLSQTALRLQTDLEAMELTQLHSDFEVKQLRRQVDTLSDKNQQYLATISKTQMKSIADMEKATVLEQKCTGIETQNQELMRQLQDFRGRNIVLERTIEQREKVIKDMQEKAREQFARGRRQSLFEQVQLSSQSQKGQMLELIEDKDNLRTERSLREEIAYLKDVNLFLCKENQEYQRISRRQVSVDTVVENSRKLLEGSKAHLQVCELNKKDIKQFLLQQKNEVLKKIQQVFDVIRFQ